MNQPESADSIKRAAREIAGADAIMVTAGAGMGVDSGLPDFRGKEGFWEAYPPIAKLGLSFSEMANPHWFESNPRLAWAFYGHRLNLYRTTTPHQGFMHLLELGKGKARGYFVFTSNVDGQFQKAGYDENRIEECHGSIHHFQCSVPCGQSIWDAGHIEVTVDEDVFQAQDPLPLCPMCGGLARPNILMFGDWNWIPERSNKQSIRLEQWLRELEKQRAKLTIIEAGAGLAVPTVRMRSESAAKMRHATLVRINPRESAVPFGHISAPLSAAEGIRQICESI